MNKIIELIDILCRNTQPIDGHDNPESINECWNELEQRAQRFSLTVETARAKRIPFKCPVCLGYGGVLDATPPLGTIPNAVECQACKGTGIIWDDN